MTHPMAHGSAVLTGLIAKPPISILNDDEPYLEEVEEADDPHEYAAATSPMQPRALTQSAHTPQSYMTPGYLPYEPP